MPFKPGDQWTTSLQHIGSTESRMTFRERWSQRALNTPNNKVHRTPERHVTVLSSQNQ